MRLPWEAELPQLTITKASSPNAATAVTHSKP